jgi:hypothetical protein
LDSWAPNWNKNASSSLTQFIFTIVYFIPTSLTVFVTEDVALRWHGNRMPEQDTEHGTLGEFYTTHRQAQHSDFYFGKVPPKWKSFKN